MIKPQKLRQIKLFLEQEDYQNAIAFLEQRIEEEPNELNYYWYLGLAYLLIEQEENAQMTWLSVISQGDEQEIKQWTQALLIILETEAHRQEKIKNFKLSWLVRGHIREIEPSLVNNLLYLIDLGYRLEYYDPRHLEDWLVVDYLANNSSEIIDSELLLKIFSNILDFPVLVNIQLLQVCLKYFADKEPLILVLKSVFKNITLKMTHDHNRVSYAIELTKICLELRPDHPVFLNHLYWLSLIAQDYGATLAPAESFLQQVESPSLIAFGHYKLMIAMMFNGLWLKAQEMAKTYIDSLQNMIAISEEESIDPIVEEYLFNLPAPLLYFQDDPLAYRQLQNQFSALFHKNRPSISHKFKTNTDNSRPLKIGYIAHTLRRHSVGMLSRWLLHYHNREEFKIYLYLINQQEDDITQIWFREKVDFIYNFSDSPEIIVNQIQQDEIDILMDLDSLTNFIAFQVLCLKPAPMQVTWLGFDASGLPSIDYFIADPYVLPDNAQDYYQETLWRLPQTYLAVDGFEVATPTLRREDFGISSDAMIYLTVQAVEKRHPDTIRLQMQILQAVPNSYLFIKGRGNQEGIQQLFKTIAKEYEIKSDRLSFLSRSPSEEIHRANLMIADVILDTYPYNGATTTLEALWMGIPLVTKVGKQFTARNSYTFMLNVGVTEGIAETDEDYIKWGIRLGTDEKLRQQINWKLHQSRQTSPLWNAKQFTKEMERAYQQMWLKHLDNHTIQ